MSLDDVYNHFFFFLRVSVQREFSTPNGHVIQARTMMIFFDADRIERNSNDERINMNSRKGREREYHHITLHTCRESSDDSMRRRDDVFQNIWLLHDGGCGRNGRHENGGGLIHQLLLLFLLKSSFLLLQFSPDVSAYLCYVHNDRSIMMFCDVQCETCSYQRSFVLYLHIYFSLFSLSVFYAPLTVEMVLKRTIYTRG